MDENKNATNSTADHLRPCALHEKMLRDIHLAVCGNKELGVDGLVADVRELKKFRSRVELKVASISGGVAVAVLALKHIFFKS